MNKTITKTLIAVAVGALGVFSPIIPTDVIKDTEWKQVSEVPAFNTDDGFLAENQYADTEVEGIYYVRGEDGFAVSTTTLSKEQTEKIEQNGYKYINFYEKADESIVKVVTDGNPKYDYEKVKRSEVLKPNIEESIELQSLAEKLVEPLVVEAGDYDIGGRSAGQVSPAAATVTFAHTVPAGFDVLIVRASNADPAGDDTQSVTYNGVSLTLEHQYSSSTREVSLWYLTDPDVGTYNVFVDLAPGAATAEDGLVVAHSYGGVDKTDVFNMTQSAYGTGTTTNILSGHVAGGYGIDTISLGDASITVNNNTEYGSRISYYDAGSDTFYTHDYFVNRSRAKSLSINSVESTPTGVFWKSDGTKMYLSGSNDDLLEQFSCSTPREVDTCTADGVTLNFGSQDTSPQDFWISPNGDRIIMLGDTNNALYSYTCSTAWTLSSCTYDSISTTTAVYETAVRGVYASDDCSKVVFVGTSLDDATTYSLSTPCDLSTANFLTAFDVGSNPTAVNITGDGYWINAIQPVTAESRMHFCSTPWDFSTCIWSRYIVPIFVSLVGDTSGMFQFQDYKQYYIVSPGTDTIYQFDYIDTATSTTMGLNNPTGNEDWITLGGILNPATTATGTATIISPLMIWEE